MTGIWVELAFVFCIWYLAHLGANHAIDFVTGYLLEESLSVDKFVYLHLGL